MTKKITTCLVSLFALAFASLSFAQPASQLFQVNLLEIKADKVELFRSIHRDFFGPRSRASGDALKAVRRTVLGNTLEFSVASPIDNMAALDSPAIAPGAEGDVGMALDLWETTVQSRQSFVIASRPDMSMEQIPAAEYSATYRFQTKSGSMQEFVQLWNSKVLPALRQSGIQGTAVYQTTAGGPFGEFWSLTPIPNYAALDGAGPFGGLEPAAATALNIEMMSLLDEMEYRVTVTDWELSFGLVGQ